MTRAAPAIRTLTAENLRQAYAEYAQSITYRIIGAAKALSANAGLVVIDPITYRHAPKALHGSIDKISEMMNEVASLLNIIEHLKNPESSCYKDHMAGWHAVSNGRARAPRYDEYLKLFQTLRPFLPRQLQAAVPVPR